MSDLIHLNVLNYIFPQPLNYIFKSLVYVGMWVLWHMRGFCDAPVGAVAHV